VAYDTAVLADSPLVYWRFGEASGTTASDTSGNGRTGTYVNSPTLGAASLIGDADTSVDFSTNQYASIANAAWQTQTDYTAEVVVQLDDVSGYRSLMGRHMSGTAAWEVRVDSGTLSFRTYNGGWSTLNGPVLTAGVVYHIAVTQAGSTKTIYLNGNSEATATHTPQVSAAGLWVGATQNGPAGYVDGRLDEFAFYGTALPASRIAAHMAETTIPPTPRPNTQLSRQAVMTASSELTINRIVSLDTVMVTSNELIINRTLSHMSVQVLMSAKPSFRGWGTPVKGNL
jgi:hypothetical protein